MKLQTVFARFYKSFNFDHLRKAHPDALAKPWETIDGTWYPYVEIPIEPSITAVVGANESGKSHLLSAIEKAITGEGFEQRDLCRYSPFFNVERGKTCWPHLGVCWSNLEETEAAQIAAALELPPTVFRTFSMFREGPDRLRVFVPKEGSGPSEIVLEDDRARSFGKTLLPRPFRIKPDVALPNSVPISWLADPKLARTDLSSRKNRITLLNAASALARNNWATDQATFQQQAQNYYPSFSNFFEVGRKLKSSDDEVSEDELHLARNLLIKLANIDPDRLGDLAKSIEDGVDGHANALITRINDQISSNINFPKWWVQDRDFALRVSPREFDLVFTIQDRTGTEYTFSERSSGLKYFLSYLIQSQSHEPLEDRDEILLMDEPDTYLSAEAQQDLLKIFHEFSEPSIETRPTQVIYVTHSPFLIDKNHAERIRVLQKGKGFDGTRVVKNVSQNHYEPLRSAFGAFVGETAFIGSCNLLVEGASDQIILAGIARVARKTGNVAGSETLDLNRLVIVPCGSASQVPYMVYLIRGRDTEKPPAIVLLDGDKSGTDAANLLRRDDKKVRRLIGSHLVKQLSEIAQFKDLSVARIEDIIPDGLIVTAINRYAREISLFADKDALLFTKELISQTAGERFFDKACAAAKEKGLTIEKIGFARALVSVCEEIANSNLEDADFVEYCSRMKVLYSEINVMRKRAERENAKEKLGSLIRKRQRIFSVDHPAQASKEVAADFLNEVEEILDNSIESDSIREHLIKLRRDFRLDDDDQRGSVDNHKKFLERIESLKDAFDIDRINP